MSSSRMEKDQVQIIDNWHILDQINDCIFVHDIETGNVVYANARACEMFGFEPEEFMGGMKFLDGCEEPYSRDDVVKWVAKAAGEGPQILEWLARHRDGRAIWVEVSLKRGVFSEKEMIFAIVRDITERKKNRELVQREQNFLYSVIENFPCGVALIDKDSRILYHNRTLIDMLGYTVEDIPTVNDSYLRFYPDETYRQKVLGIWLNNTGEKDRERVFTVACKNGERKEIDFRPTLLSDGRIIMAMLDVTSRKNAEKQLKYLATHDFLTGIPNRYAFEETLRKAILRAKTGTKSALLFIDIDNFKLVNDTHGHAAGDELLIKVINILKKNLRQDDILARLGGDEFAILLQDTTDDQARAIAERLRVSMNGNEAGLSACATFNLSLSIGIVMADGSLTSQNLLSLADTALYAAKDEGRNRIVHLETKEEIAAQYTGINRVISLVKDAIENNRFILHFQPVVKIHDGGIAHHEALLRLQGENGDLIAPNEFIPYAERFGLMPQIDCRVLQSTVEILQKNPGLNIFINISGTSLCDVNLLKNIEQRILQSNINPSRIGFEITETAFVKDLHLAERWIKGLKSLGCRFALDDFGMGFSSFSYLRMLPVDYLKIDGSFIINLDKDPSHRALVQAMNTVAHTLGKQTIAEYVEKEGVLEILRELQVDCGQGNFWSKPHQLQIN